MKRKMKKFVKTNSVKNCSLNLPQLCDNSLTINSKSAPKQYTPLQPDAQLALAKINPKIVDLISHYVEKYTHVFKLDLSRSTFSRSDPGG